MTYSNTESLTHDNIDPRNVFILSTIEYVLVLVLDCLERFRESKSSVFSPKTKL